MIKKMKEDVLFLDANVLFSASYREESGILRFWRLKAVKLVSSAYAIEEARRNLSLPQQRERLEKLLANVETPPCCYDDIQLPEKCEDKRKRIGLQFQLKQITLSPETLEILENSMEKKLMV